MRATEPALLHPSFRGVRLLESDATAGLALSTEAGWNQIETDWRFMLRTGVGFGFEAADGRLVASAMLVPYGRRFAWISMVLVSSAARRQGLATTLLQHALELGARREEELLLDATADGRKVYLPLGFRDLRAITRWTCASCAPQRASFPAGITALASPDEWISWDEARFGASRRELLRALHAASPGQAWQSGRPGEGRGGFCLARPGRVATQLGPLVANDEATAVTLLSAALHQAAGPHFVDIVDGWTQLEAVLRQQGFVPSRHFIRMIHGAAPEPGMPGQIFAITGPEFG